MESIGPENHLHAIEELPFEQFTSPTSPETTGLHGSPQVNTRVGNEYQVEVPPMISESEYQRLLMDPFHSEGTVDLSHSFLGRLTIPIMWATRDKVNNRKNDDSVEANGSSKSTKSKRTYVSKKKGSKINAESMDAELGKKGLKQPKLPTKVVGKSSTDQLEEKKNHFPVPGSQTDPWSNAQVNCFVLGLFVFGKNFVQVKRFMDSNAMGEILSFYYGEFYKSDNYRRWIECRKTRRRKSVFGQKIFTGWRQQELLSRLHPHIPENCQQTILEVSTAFTEGKFSLEDYVSKLRAIVGIEVLVEAIGIGKGKEDLTSLSMEPGKINPLFPVCPIGKACASLTSSDIIKLLTGSIRLSKARCNDIFWEAIWPRLLAKGWHSEQATNQGYLDSKHQIVFLIPGVTKFSRRSLVKGNHYFDSVSDVLNKVASEPKLIELESEDSRSYNEEDGVLTCQDDPSVKSSHHYLKPRVSTSDLNLLKFTVVDSSFEQEGKLSKVREMRYSLDDLKLISFLPILSSRNKRVFSDSVDKNELEVDIPQDDRRNLDTADCKEIVSDDCGGKKSKLTIVDTSSVHGGKSKVQELRYPEAASEATSETTKSLTEAERHSSEDPLNKHTPAAGMISSRGKNANKFYRRKVRINTDGSNSNQKGLDSNKTNKPIEDPRDQNHLVNGNHSSKTIKHQFSRRSKSGHSNNLVPLMKRWRLTACSKSEISNVSERFFGGQRSIQMGPSSALNSLEPGSNASQLDSDEKKIPSTSPSFEACSNDGRAANGSQVEMSRIQHVEHRAPSLINLNLPPANSDSDNGESVSMGVEDKEGTNASDTCFPSNADKIHKMEDRHGSNTCSSPNTGKIDHGSTTSVDVNPAAKQLDMNPRRQSKRNQPLTTRALESLQCDFLHVKKQKGMRAHIKGIAFSSPSRRARSKIKTASSGIGVCNRVMEAKEETNTNEACDSKRITLLPPS